MKMMKRVLTCVLLICAATRSFGQVNEKKLEYDYDPETVKTTGFPMKVNCKYVVRMGPFCGLFQLKGIEIISIDYSKFYDGKKWILASNCGLASFKELCMDKQGDSFTCCGEIELSLDLNGAKLKDFHWVALSSFEEGLPADVKKINVEDVQLVINKLTITSNTDVNSILKACNK
jgi:hypothetical protein